MMQSRKPEKDKIVLDTNIFISGIFWNGDSRKILDLWKNEDISIITSIEIIIEIYRIIDNFKIQISPQKKLEWIDTIKKFTICVHPIQKFNIVIDPDDNKVIDAAVASNAKYIITNDNHLLQIKKFRNTQILTPKEYLEKK